MIYCDTSLLATALLPEAASGIVQQWLGRHDGRLAISPWVHTEFVGAIARKRRLALLADADVERVLAVWTSVRGAVAMLPLGNADFDEAGQMALRSSGGLRAGDALHLAIASRGGHMLASLDRRLLSAAAEFGVAPIDPLAD